MESLAAIEALVRSAELGSFSAAARKLGVTPAAISKSVARLERGLGVRLCQRTTRSLTLTEAGERFVAEAGTGLAAVQAAVANVGSARAPAGVLRVSMSPSFGRAYVLPMLPGFLQRYPDIRPDWQFDSRQVDLVGDGYDAAIGAAIELPAGVVVRELARAHFVAVASPAYLARRPAPRKPSDLADHDGLQLRSPQTGRLRSYPPFRTKAGARASFELRPRLIFDDLEAICQAAQAGLGIGLVSMPYVAGPLERGTLVRVLPRWYADAGAIFVYFGGTRHLPAKTRVFVDAIVEHFARERLAARFRAD